MNKVVEVRLLNRVERIVHDNPALVEASAERVQEKLDELRRGGAGASGERLMLLVALNLAEDLIRAEKALQEGSVGLTSSLESLESLSGSLANAPLR